MGLFISVYEWILYDWLGYTIDMSASYYLQPLALLMTYLFIFALIVVMWKLIFWVINYLKGFMPL